MIQNLFKIGFFGLLISSFSCGKPLKTNTYYQTDYATGRSEKHSGISIEGKEKYPIEVFFLPEKPGYATESLQVVEISEELPLNERDELVKGRMVKRGKQSDEKKKLLAQLIEKAQNIGASCLVDVNYQYYSTTTKKGYKLSGLASRHLLEKVN